MAYLPQIFGSMIDNLNNDMCVSHRLFWNDLLNWYFGKLFYVLMWGKQQCMEWFFLCRLFFFLSKMSLEHVTSIRMNNIRNYTTWLLGAIFYLHIETYHRMKIRWNIISCLTNLTFIIIKNIVILATYLDIGWILSIVSKKGVIIIIPNFVTFRVCSNGFSIWKVQDVFSYTILDFFKYSFLFSQ